MEDREGRRTQSMVRASICAFLTSCPCSWWSMREGAERRAEATAASARTEEVRVNIILS